MSQSPSSVGFQGLLQQRDGTSAYAAQAFIVKSILTRIATTTLVEVMAVTNAGDDSAVGFVDIHPLVNQVDGDGNAVQHGTIYGCPYFRLQGGANAIILDPQVGDIGIAVFASRDLSSVIATKAQANPNSGRTFSWADGLYIGGVLNGVPTQYVRFSPAGIEIHSPTQVKLSAPDVQIQCATLEIAATASAEITTPTFTVNGNHIVTGNAVVEGTSLVDGVLTVTANTVITGTAQVLELQVGGKTIDASHTHNLTGGGHTLGVT